jgi:hypothetical protein
LVLQVNFGVANITKSEFFSETRPIKTDIKGLSVWIEDCIITRNIVNLYTFRREGEFKISVKEEYYDFNK